MNTDDWAKTVIRCWGLHKGSEELWDHLDAWQKSGTMARTQRSAVIERMATCFDLPAVDPPAPKFEPRDPLGLELRRLRSEVMEEIELLLSSPTMRARAAAEHIDALVQAGRCVQTILAMSGRQIPPVTDLETALSALHAIY